MASTAGRKWKSELTRSISPMGEKRGCMQTLFGIGHYTPECQCPLPTPCGLCTQLARFNEAPCSTCGVVFCYECTEMRNRAYGVDCPCGQRSNKSPATGSSYGGASSIGGAIILPPRTWHSDDEIKPHEFKVHVGYFEDPVSPTSPFRTTPGGRDAGTRCGGFSHKRASRVEC